MKGILLAGGSGTRLGPLTVPISKQLLPIYDKPLVYYPLSVLMLAGITDILIITTPKDQLHFQHLLGDGQHLGINLQYAEQSSPRGIADAFLVAEAFIGADSVCLILGDNIFYGDGLPAQLQQIAKISQGAYIFGYYVDDPSRYGVVEVIDNKIVNLVEKPQQPKSNFAVTGLYFYDNQVVSFAKTIKPSARNELEITDINRLYLQKNQLQLAILGRGMAWLDTGTVQSLYDATNFVKVIESRQGLKIACLEEIAYRMGYISRHQLTVLGSALSSSDYGEYLMKIVEKESQLDHVAGGVINYV